EGDAGRIVPGGPETQNLAALEVYDTYGVVAAVADVERGAVYRQRAGHTAEDIESAPPDGNGTDDLRAGNVEDGDTVASGVGDIGEVALHGDAGRVQADREMLRLAGVAVNEADRAGGRRAARVHDDERAPAFGLLVVFLRLPPA